MDKNHIFEYIDQYNKKRDTYRIDTVLKVIKTIWKKNPDLRLGQIMQSCCSDNEEDLFYLEDDVLLERLINQFRN